MWGVDSKILIIVDGSGSVKKKVCTSLQLQLKSDWIGAVLAHLQVFVKQQSGVLSLDGHEDPEQLQVGHVPVLQQDGAVAVPSQA